jgi:alkanesulfonate monooxygenase SsuD/methylene tetrahydromethanopterin reductase-like flavin-dependent oxidoreductase (luciferase family)
MLVATNKPAAPTQAANVTYRHPSINAAEAVTVDHVSRGRLELGLGASWFETEHWQLGIDFPRARERAHRLEEATQVMRLLMTQDNASFDGRYYQLHDATYRPRPVQRPHPPIWIGAGGERLMLPIVGRQADAWHAFGAVEDLVRKARIVDEHARRAGRDPASIVRSSSLSLSQPWDEVRARVEALRKAGFSYLVVSWPSEGKARLDKFVETVMPSLIH